MSLPDGVKVRPPKWEFTLSITSGLNNVMTHEGPIDVTQIVMMSWPDRTKVEVRGRAVGVPKFNPAGHRTVIYNVGGYPGKPAMPEWLADLLRLHAFPKVEV